MSLTADEAFDRAFEARVAERRRRHLTELGDEVTAWLAVVPAWTAQLALACEFPTGSEPLDQVLVRAEAAGLCEWSRPAGAASFAWDRAWAIGDLAPHLPPELLPKAFHAVLAVPNARLRAEALVELGPHLPDDLLTEGLSTVEDLDERIRAQALAGLAPHLPPRLLETALALARSLTDPVDRATAMAAVAGALPADARQEVFEEAMREALWVEDPAGRATALSSLVPHLPTVASAEPGRHEGPNRAAALAAAVSVVAAVARPSLQVELLRQLVPYMEPPLLEETAALVRSVEDPELRCHGFVALAGAWPDRRRQLALEAAEAAATVASPAARTACQGEAAVAVARSGAADAAIRLAETIDNDQSRVSVMSAIADALAASGEHRRAAGLAMATLSPASRVRTSSLERPMLRLAEAGRRGEAVLLAERLLAAEGGLGQVAAVAALGAAARVLALAGEGHRAVDVARHALQAAAEIADPRERSDALLRLAPLLGEEAHDLALDAARVVSDPAARLRALIAVLPHLPVSQRHLVAAEALTLAEATGDVPSFAMPAQRRPEVLDELGRRLGPDYLGRVALSVGKRLRDVSARLPVPPALARWTDLAARAGDAGPASAAGWLDAHIADLVRRGETGPALAWSETGAALAQVLGGDLDAVARLGHRRVELLHRQEQDRRQLQHFLRREEQLHDIDRLLDEDDATWALHFLGSGGIGKTMLLRYLTADLAPARGIPTSRVDFDHISPEYPVRRPGQLLRELADELRAQVTSRHQELAFAEFQTRLVQLHEGLSDRSLPADPLGGVRGQDFERALVAFADLLRLLPQPVLLVLDTCEELTKLRHVGTRMPAVEATFSILERLHDLLPTVRVVFAGRHLLARSGPGWRASMAEETTAPLPEGKDYLQLHWVRGFTQAEATTLLSGVWSLARSRPLREAVLTRSEETGSIPPVVWQPPRPAATEPRYNPFDLGLYADWARQEPDLDPAVVAAGQSDQYVQIRIIDRIQRPDVRAVLPAAVLLGRFDTAMLWPAFRHGDEAFADLWTELAGLEWIDYQPDDALGTAFLEIDRNLRRRLLAWYANVARRYVLDEATRHLGPGLAALVAARPLEQLGVDHVDATLRLLPAADAASVWEGLETRAAAEAAWHWARAVTDRLLGEDGVAGPRGHPLHAHVLATHCAALRHEQPDAALGPLWTEIEQTAAAHPDPEVRDWLERRARLGQLAAWAAGHDRAGQLPETLQDELRRTTNEPPVPEGPARARAEQLAASACAAVEAVIEAAERGGTGTGIDPAPISGWLTALGHQGISPRVLTFATTLAARAGALSHRFDDAAAYLRAARVMLEVSEDRGLQCWLDWRAPDRLLDRVRLEALRLPMVTAGPRGADGLATWQREASGRLDEIDAERLVSAILRHRLATGPVPADELEALAEADRYLPTRQPVSNAHRAVPPLFVTVALAWLALGDGERALALLERRSDQAVKSGRDQATIRGTELAKVDVLRRLRLARREPALVDRLTGLTASGGSEALAPALMALLVLDRPRAADRLPPPGRGADPAKLHAWWRCQVGLTRQAAAQAVDRLREATGQPAGASGGEGSLQAGEQLGPLPPDAGFDELALALDLAEAARMVRGSDVSLKDFQDSLTAWSQAHPLDLEGQVRLELRCAALDRRAGDSAWLDGPAGQIGRRRLAELALDEGELLALRLPDEAAHLLDLAGSWFENVGDLAGAVTAHTCAAIARIHATTGTAKGVTTDGAGTAAAQGAYERLASSGLTPALPAWGALQAAAATPRQEDLDGLVGHPAWRGWLERLLACLAWEQRAGTQDPVLGRWLQQRHGGRLPAELDLTTAQAPAIVSPQPSARARRWLGSRRVRRVFTWLLLLAICILSFALSGERVLFGPTVFNTTFRDGLVESLSYLSLASLILVPISWRVRTRNARRIQVWLALFAVAVVIGVFGPSDAEGNPSGAAWKIVFVLWCVLLVYLVVLPIGWLFRVGRTRRVVIWVLLLLGLVSTSLLGGVFFADQTGAVGIVEASLAGLTAALYLLIVLAPVWWFVSRRIDAVRAARTQFDLTIWSGPEARVAAVRLWWRAGRLFWRRRSAATGLHEETCPVPGPGPYREAASGMPDTLVADLAGVQKRLRRRWVPVPVEVEPALAQVPWEALMALALPATGSAPPLDRLRFWRAGPPARDSTPGPAERRLGVICLADARWTPMTERGWSALGSPMAYGTGDDPAVLDTFDRPLVLHLIGTPVGTSAGPRFRVGEAAAVGARSAEAAVRGHGALLAVDRLPLDRFQLVVLQEEPVGATARLDTERARTADLRALAADAFMTGPAGMVMLPALPPEIAERVIGLLAEHVHADATGTGWRELLDAVTRTRRHVAAAPPPAAYATAREAGDERARRWAETRLELALDITLFARRG